MSIVTLASKDLRVLRRDKWGLVWVVAFPLMIALLFGAIFSEAGSGPSGTMRIAVVDEDDSDTSRAYIQKLEASKALDVVQLGRAEAQEEVRKGKLVAYAVLKKGFGETPGLFFGEASPLELGIDPSRKAESSYLRGLLVQKSFEVLQEKFSDPQTLRKHMQDLTKDIDTSTALSPVQHEVLKRFMGDLDKFLGDIETVSVSVSKTGPRSSFEITFPQAILWGLLGCAAAFGISIVTERVGGTYLRLRLAPISRSQILAGKGLACFVACVSVAVLLLAVGISVLKVRVGSYPMLAVSIVCAALCFVGIMMFISVLGKTEQSVAGAGWAILLVMSMLGGGMVPLIFMPGWMQKLSHVSPMKWAIVSLEGAIWRGFSPLEMLLPWFVLTAAGAVFFVVGVTIFSRADA